MSRQIRRRIAKLIEDLEEGSEEVVLVFAPWALGPQASEARKADSTPQAPTPPESPSGAPPQRTP
jgi:hypothetical protein